MNKSVSWDKESKSCIKSMRHEKNKCSSCFFRISPEIRRKDSVSRLTKITFIIFFIGQKGWKNLQFFLKSSCIFIEKNLKNQKSPNFAQNPSNFADSLENFKIYLIESLNFLAASASVSKPPASYIFDDQSANSRAFFCSSELGLPFIRIFAYAR